MPRQRTPPQQASPIEKVWLARQFEQIDNELDQLKQQNNDIIQLIQNLVTAIGGSPNTQVIPELERIVRKVALRADTIDAKVPD